MNPILGYIVFAAFWGGIVSMLFNYKEPNDTE